MTKTMIMFFGDGYTAKQEIQPFENYTVPEWAKYFVVLDFNMDNDEIEIPAERLEILMKGVIT
jgi:hypothetical protein